MYVHSKHQHWLLFATYAIYHYLPIPDHACVERLVCLHNLVPFSSRLRGLVIRSTELVGYEGFEGVGIERLVELLNRLRVAVEDMVWFYSWGRFLMGVLQTSEGTRLLSHWHWEVLMELAI